MSPTAKCWSCGAAPGGAGLAGDVPSVQPETRAVAICAACGKVQPPPPAGVLVDKFALLGLRQVQKLDEAELDASFRALSRKLHPDRFAKASSRERRFSLEQTTLLNDAYRTLKDPARRAEHLLQLRGVKPMDDFKMPPDFLEQALEDREQLLEAKQNGVPLEPLAQGIRAKMAAAMAEVEKLLADGSGVDAGRSTDRDAASAAPDSQARAAELLARMRYYARYLDEVEGREPELS
jgi:molecular chaperone HscB